MFDDEAGGVADVAYQAVAGDGVAGDQTATVVVKAHAFIQNLRRGFYELAVDVRPKDRLVAAFAELAMAI